MILTLTLTGAAVAGAIAFRIRGGWWPDDWPGQAARGVYAAILTVVMLLPNADASSADWFLQAKTSAEHAAGWPTLGLAVALWSAWFLGAIWPTLGAIDAGRNDGSPWGDGMFNSLRGIVYTAPPAIVLGLWGSGPEAVALPLAGACMGACYEAAWRVSRETPTVVAEALTGACFGVGAVLAVVLQNN